MTRQELNARKIARLEAQVVSTIRLCRSFDGDACWNDVLLTEKTNHTIVMYGEDGKETACDFVDCGEKGDSDA